MVSKTLTQPELGHLQKSNIQPLKYLNLESENNEFKIGQVLNVDSFLRSTCKYKEVRNWLRWDRRILLEVNGSKNHRAIGGAWGNCLV
jgi:hypothetical protein